ncbi:MAG TPA: DUF6242 domain-containing protein, partial [Parasegetibacter sp.]
SFTIDHSDFTIYNQDSVPFGTDVSAEVATFTPVPKATVTVGSVVQQSGVTVNDFTNPVVYTVTAEDGVTTRQYTVKVNVAKTDPKAVAWQQVTASAGFGSFHDVQAGYYKNKFYVLGSTIGSFSSFTFGVFESTDGINWTRLKAADNNNDSVPMVEHGKLVTGFKDKMWLLGGLKPSDGFSFSAVLNKVWSTSDGTNWTVEPDPAQPTDRWDIRERINAVVFQDKLWVIGGNAYPSFGNTNAFGAAKNDVWNSVDGQQWTRLTADAGFLPRSAPAVFVYKNKIWMVGGRDNGGNSLNEIWTSSDGQIWTQVTTQTPPPNRWGHAVVAHNNQLFLIGGENADGVYGDLWVSEDDGVNWTKVEAGDSRALPANFPKRVFFNAFVANNSIWIIGGLGEKNEGNAYTIPTDIWKGTLN